MGLRPSCCTSCSDNNDTFHLMRNTSGKYQGITSFSNMDKSNKYGSGHAVNPPIPHSRFDKSTSKSLSRLLVNGYIRRICREMRISDNIMTYNYVFQWIQYLCLEYLYFTMNLITKPNHGSFEDLYQNPSVLDMIGEDGSGYWYYTSTKPIKSKSTKDDDEKDRYEQFCIKKFQKLHATPKAIYDCESEIDILSKLDHRNIINLQDIYEDAKEVCLIYEYCAGQDLDSKVDAREYLNEYEAKIVFKQILSGIKYLHKHGIIHLNLKPESIWFKYGKHKNNMDWRHTQRLKSINSMSKTLSVALPMTPYTPNVSNTPDALSKGQSYDSFANPPTATFHAELPSLPSLSMEKSSGSAKGPRAGDRHGHDYDDHQYDLCIFNFEMAQKVSLLELIQRSISGTKEKKLTHSPRLSLFDHSSSDRSDIYQFNNYSAPELLQDNGYNGYNKNNISNYSTACDLWSAGCILYFILCGKAPFEDQANDDMDSDSESEIKYNHNKQMRNGQYFFTTKEWNNLSENARDLISKLLQQHPNERLTAKQALKHKWFKTL